MLAAPWAVLLSLVLQVFSDKKKCWTQILTFNICAGWLVDGITGRLNGN